MAWMGVGRHADYRVSRVNNNTSRDKKAAGTKNTTVLIADWTKLPGK